MLGEVALLGRGGWRGAGGDRGCGEVMPDQPRSILMSGEIAVEDPQGSLPSPRDHQPRPAPGQAKPGAGELGAHLEG